MEKKGRAATVGMFDGVHAGHRFLLDSVKRSSSGGLPVVVTFTNHPLSLISPDNAPRLLMTADEKIRALEALGLEPLVVDFDEKLRTLTAEQFLVRLRDEKDVTTLAVGFNNRFGSDRKRFSDLEAIGRKLGIEVIGIPEYAEKVSSTLVREAIAKGDVESANRYLGRPYSIAGTVVDGNHIGRTIGFPTANLVPEDQTKIIPANGVYAADAELGDGRCYRAVVNIGNRPTVDNSPEVHIEAFLDGFSGNLYGQRLRLSFLARLRDERRFPDMESLRRTIADDLARARGYNGRFDQES